MCAMLARSRAGPRRCSNLICNADAAAVHRQHDAAPGCCFFHHPVHVAMTQTGYDLSLSCLPSRWGMSSLAVVIMLHICCNLSFPQLDSPGKSRRQHTFPAAPYHSVHVELATACSRIRACCVHDASRNLLCDEFQLLLQDFSLQGKRGSCEVACLCAEELVGAVAGWGLRVMPWRCAEGLECTHACAWSPAGSMQPCRYTVQRPSAEAYILHTLVILFLRELLGTTHCHNCSSIATGCAWGFILLHGHVTMQLGCLCLGFYI